MGSDSQSEAAVEPRTESGYGTVVFQEATVEYERVNLLAEEFHPGTAEVLTDLGVGAGWRCLDVGAGSGHLVSWLAERTAPDQVVALDRGTQFLRSVERRHPNIQVVQADALDPSYSPDGFFDLIHARFVLMHLPERERLLDRMLTWLRPGGWIVLSDGADLSASSASAAYRAVMRATWECAAKVIGTDERWARSFPDPLHRRGLLNIHTRTYLPLLRGQCRQARFWELTLKELMAHITGSGTVTAGDVDNVLTALADPTFQDLGMVMFTTYGRIDHARRDALAR